MNLTDVFLIDLFKLCFYKKEVVETVSAHLEFSYIPKELPNYKKVLKSIVTLYKLKKELPELSVVSQQHSGDEKVQELLLKISERDIPKTDLIIPELESYLRKVKFIEIFNKTKEIYNQEDDQEKAISYLEKKAVEVANFCITKDSSKFIKVIDSFEGEMHKKRDKSVEEHHFDKVPFGIDPLDQMTEGGIDLTDIALFIARSGVGKSTVLKWCAVSACRLGYDVLHIQIEGTKDEAWEHYTQIISSINRQQVRLGNIPEGKEKSILRAYRNLKEAGKDIYLYAFEMFDEATMFDVRQLILEYQKERGKIPDLVILDSVDLVSPGDGVKYGVDTQSIKMKLQNSSKKMKNIASELKTRFITATQTGDISFDVWNNPDRVITRSDSMGDKNIANPYSYVVTLNQTQDEYNKNRMRLYIDKFRNYRIQQRIIPICTAFSSGRFFDRKATMLTFNKDV